MNPEDFSGANNSENEDLIKDFSDEEMLTDGVYEDDPDKEDLDGFSIRTSDDDELGDEFGEDLDKKDDRDEMRDEFGEESMM